MLKQHEVKNEMNFKIKKTPFHKFYFFDFKSSQKKCHIFKYVVGYLKKMLTQNFVLVFFHGKEVLLT
jgi:hypothetical protein